MLSGLLARSSSPPRREVLHRPGEKVVSPKRGYSHLGEKAPGASVLSGVFSPRREILHPGEEIFSLRREYFRLGKNGQCFLDYFRLNDKFFTQARGYFRSGKVGLAQAKKNYIFWLFVFDYLTLLECNICI